MPTIISSAFFVCGLQMSETVITLCSLCFAVCDVVFVYDVLPVCDALSVCDVLFV